MWVAQLSQAWHWKLPKSTLELVVVGRMHGMHVRPGQLLRHRVWQAQTITAQRGYTGQLRWAFSSPFFSSPPLSLISPSLFIAHFLPCTPSLGPHKACSHIPLFPLCLSNCCGLKRGWREGNEIERKRQWEGELEGKGVIPQKLYVQDKLYWPSGIVKTLVCGVYGYKHLTLLLSIMTQKDSHLANFHPKSLSW